MKTLFVLCGMIFIVFLMPDRAFSLNYAIDVTGDAVGDSSVSISVGDFVTADIYLEGYNCPPSDQLFGVSVYISIDESAVTVDSCYPNDDLHGGPFDDTLSGCQWQGDAYYTPDPDVWLLVCSNFSFIDYTEPQLLGTIEFSCDNEIDFTLTAANDIGEAFNDGFVSDCNLESLYPTDATVVIDQFVPPCECDISGPYAIQLEGFNQVTVQYTVAPANPFCSNTPNYVWSDTCDLADIDQTGLLTVGPAVVDETCRITVIDTANTGDGGSVVECSKDILLKGGWPPDLDWDGVLDCDDNCLFQPNGYLWGTCVREVGGVVVGWRINCYDSEDCEVNEYCDMDQGDFNQNGIGDACEICFANCNCDNKIDLADLVIIKQEFLRDNCSEIEPCYADCNGDNKVDLADVSVMKYEFLRTGCPFCS